MNINEIKIFFEFIINKNQSGNSFTITQFNLAAQRAQMEEFERLYKIFEENQDVTDDMAEFLIPGILNVPEDGQLLYPSDYAHAASVRSIYWKDNTSTERPLKQVKNADWGTTVSSSIVMPTKRYPAMTFYNTYMQFAPSDIGIVRFDYFKIPTSPVWNYTMVNNRPVYDPITSVDFEFPDTVHDTLILIMANFMGINLSKQDLLNWTQAEKQIAQ